MSPSVPRTLTVTFSNLYRKVNFLLTLTMASVEPKLQEQMVVNHSEDKDLLYKIVLVPSKLLQKLFSRHTPHMARW